MTKSNERLTIVKCLEKFFGDAPLVKENRRLFLGLNTRKADDLFNYFHEYLNLHGDFYVPERRPTFSRPFVWHEISKSTASSIGGDAFNYNNERPAESKTGNLRSLLLLHHQVAITDQLHFLLSVLSRDVENDCKTRYEEYLDFLILNRELIEEGILIICSDREAYRTAPVNLEPDKYADPNITEFVQEQLDKDAYLLAGTFVSRMLAYMALTERLHSDEFVDTQSKLDVYRSIHNYWEVAIKYPNPSSVVHREDINLSTRALSNQDIVNIRLNDEAFLMWRDAFSSALEEKTIEEFKDRMHEGVVKLQEQLPPTIKGTPKSIFLGLLSNTLTTLITGDPIAGIATGTALGSGFELVDKSIRRKAERARMAAKNALTLHFTALLQSDVAPPKINQQSEHNWLNEFLKRRRKAKQ